MKNKTFKIIQDGITNTSEAKKGKNIFYKCLMCDEIISCSPKDNIRCKCGNITIDVDYARLYVKDYMKFQSGFFE